ncbi:hypothetical protein P5V15_010759 [Pogonomyrmex californicus]
METDDGKHCMHYVVRKKRFCRMTVREGRRYCGEHQRDVAGCPDERVPCPLDPTHTCYRSKLTRHLSVCNAKRKLDTRPAFVIEGANLDDETVAMPLRVPLSQLDESVVETVIRKIHAAYEKLSEFPRVILQHDVLKDKLNDKTCGSNVKKHLLQNASLLGHLEQAGLVCDDTCFIEFGAGKDLSIRCLVNSIKNEPKVDVRGLVLAFCCHHKCEYSSYVGREYLQGCDFTADEFPVLCSIVSWATCRLKNDRSELDEREVTGRKAKILLNWGRLVFLKNAGFQAELLYYTSTDVSLENMCIVATRECSS